MSSGAMPIPYSRSPIPYLKDFAPFQILKVFSLNR